MCDENVLRLASIDCSSPMSANTRPEHRQLRDGGRQMQPGLCHQCEQPRRLQGHGLAARIRSGDQQHAIRRIEEHVYRHGVFEHRVARRLQLQACVDCELGLDAVDLRAVTSLGLQHVELACHFTADDHVRRPRAETIRQLEQDAQDLFALAILELDDVVVDLDGGGGLEKQRRAGRRRAVDDARHVAAMLGPHHQHEPAVALGDDFVLQILGGGSARVLLERAAELLPLLSQLIADPFQLGARAVEHLAAGIDRVAHRGDFILERADVGDQLAKSRKFRPGAPDAGARLIDAVHEVGQHAQLQRLERPARDFERIERFRQRLARAQRKQRMPLKKLDRLAGGRLSGDDDVRISRRRELRQRRRSQRRQRQRGDGIDNAIEFEGAGGEHGGGRA